LSTRAEKGKMSIIASARSVCSGRLGRDEAPGQVFHKMREPGKETKMKSSLKAKVIFCLVGLLLSSCVIKDRHKRTAPVVRGDIILRVFVVRHGEANKNVPHPADVPEEKLDSLTPRGFKQATSIGKFLKDKAVVAVIASPTGRTCQTADAIVEALGLVERYSQDKSFGSITGDKTPDGKPVTWSWRQKQWASGRDPRPEGGESLADGVARAVDAIDRLTKKYPGRAVAIVSHGDICAGLLGHADDTSITECYELHNVPTGSVSEIVITDVGWYLLSEGVIPPAEQ
jgi:broad specificity phosphatase PhoE